MTRLKVTNYHLLHLYKRRRQMSEDQDRCLGTYYGGEEQVATVTVRWLDTETDDNGQKLLFVEITCQVWEDANTLDYADHWQITWCHYSNTIKDSLGPYLDVFCPHPQWVKEAALDVPLPPALKGLFNFREADTESSPTNR
jgi:hypothetical protein